MNKCYKFEDENFEVFIEDEVFIKDIKKKSYYKNKIENLPKSLIDNLFEYTPKITINFFIGILIFFVFLFLLNYYMLHDFNNKFANMSATNYEFYLFFIIYLFCNIFLHEISHIGILRYFGKKHDKVGFKMNFYVFPSIYVEINEVLLLSKREKIFVHLAGLLVNYLTINLIQLVNINMIHSNILSNCFIFFSYAMWWNLIPVLNSDGYKILITVFNIEELENKRKNHFVVKVIQGIGVILAIRSLILWFI